MNDFAVILFHSPHHALKAAKLIKNSGLEVRMIPVPRHLSHECGFCVRIFKGDVEAAMKIIIDNQLNYDRIEGL